MSAVEVIFISATKDKITYIYIERERETERQRVFNKK